MSPLIGPEGQEDYLDAHTLRSWLLTTDHKRIGLLYMAAITVFFFIGGGEALLIRLQLARPNQKLLSAELYNQVFTMHGVTMVFLYALPMQLIAYHTACALGCDVDQPRNLAKSVTVE